MDVYITALRIWSWHCLVCQEVPQVLFACGFLQILESTTLPYTDGLSWLVDQHTPLLGTLAWFFRALPSSGRVNTWYPTRLENTLQRGPAFRSQGGTSWRRSLCRKLSAAKTFSVQTLQGSSSNVGRQVDDQTRLQTHRRIRVHVCLKNVQPRYQRKMCPHHQMWHLILNLILTHARIPFIFNAQLTTVQQSSHKVLLMVHYLTFTLPNGHIVFGVFPAILRDMSFE